MYFIGIDLGTSACKMLLVDEAGQVCGTVAPFREAQPPVYYRLHQEFPVSALFRLLPDSQHVTE